MSEKKDKDGDPETFWKAMERDAAVAQEWPSWMKGGINLNERNFVTFRSAQPDPDVTFRPPGGFGGSK